MGVVVLAQVVLFLLVCVCVRCLWLLVAHRVDEGGSGRLVLRAMLFSPLEIVGSSYHICQKVDGIYGRCYTMYP